jgi:type IV secretion system protein VirB10
MADPSTTPPDPSSAPGRVLDHRRLPPGVIPRHLQQWVLIGTAVGMVAILVIVRPPTRPQPTTAPAAALAVDANQQRIEDFQRRIQEQAERLASEQAQLESTKDALANTDVAVPRRPVSNAAASSPRLTRPRETPAASVRVADSLAFSRGQSQVVSVPVPTIPAAADASVAAVAPVVSSEIVPAGAIAPTRAAPPLASREASVAPPPPAPRLSMGPTYTVYEGTVIETVLTNRLDGTFTGPVNCLVSVPVYARDQLVIPAGARVLGEARAVSTFGQSRLAVTFHRVLLPNQTSIDLDEVPGLNQAGDLGLVDQVDRHYGQIFGASLALGAIAGFAQAGTGYGFDATSLDAYRQGIASNVSQSSTRVLDRFLNLLPTVTIREGHRIKVYLTRDLELPAYQSAHPVAGGRP